MYRKFQIIIALLLSLATLFGSAGISLHKMACLSSGKVSISLEQDFCCAGDRLPEEPSFAAVCCDFDQLEFAVSEFDFKKSSVQAAAVPAQVASTYTPAFSLHLREPLYEKLIPPLENAQRLRLLCSYII